VPFIILPNEGFAGTLETLPPDVRARDFAYLWDLMCCPDRDPALRQYAYAASNSLYTLERSGSCPRTAGTTREMIDDLREDRDRWREQATRLLPAPQPDARRGWWRRLRGK
jgi:hypothetical protein